MYLAGILALWALLHPPVRGGVGSVRSPMASAVEHIISSSAQEPAKPETPPPQSQDQPKPSTSQNPQETTQSQDTQPQNIQPQDSQPQHPAPQQEGAPSAGATPEKKPNPAQKPTAAGSKKRAKKKPSPPVAGEEQKKKVISHGSTEEPITVLAPGMTDEQAARQRAVTDQLLASTGASLQRLSTRSLNKDQQDTVAQIRKFMEQVKTAQAAGDLQRAYKLAVKAHLLADALEKS